MSIYYGRVNSGILYVSPKPYPIPVTAYDYNSNVVTADAACLDLGRATGNVFIWQALIGLPLGLLGTFTLLGPLLIVFVSVASGDTAGLMEFFSSFIDKLLLVGFIGGGVLFVVIGNAILNSINEKAHYIPVRFNRQRRQVCLVPEGKTEPVVVDWEDLRVWVGDYVSATQHGVLKHHSLGFAFQDKANGEEYYWELSSTGLPMALGTWELIRSYMDYEIHSLSETIPPDDVDPSTQGGMEGVAFFKAKHRRLRRRFREGEVGLFYVLGWYLYHICTFWTVPNHLVEWEVREVERKKTDNVPEAMKRWSEPLPESEWRLPSKAFLEESHQVRSIFARSDGLTIYDAFNVVHELMSQKHSIADS